MRGASVDVNLCIISGHLCGGEVPGIYLFEHMVSRGGFSPGIRWARSRTRWWETLDGGGDRDLSPLDIRVFALVFRSSVCCVAARIESLRVELYAGFTSVPLQDILIFIIWISCEFIGFYNCKRHRDYIMWKVSK